jgi:hypothetical protein
MQQEAVAFERYPSAVPLGLLCSANVSSLTESFLP